MKTKALKTLSGVTGWPRSGGEGLGEQVSRGTEPALSCFESTFGLGSTLSSSACWFGQRT